MKNLIKPLMCYLVALCCPMLSFGQYTTSPALNTNTACTGGSMTCSSGTWNGGTIRAAILSVTSSSVVIRVSKCSGNFLFSGSIIMQSSVCSTVCLASATFPINTSYKDVVVPVSLAPGQTVSMVALVSAGFNKYYSGSLSVTRLCEGSAQWYSQANPAWGGHYMGLSGNTVTNKGCAMTDVAMLLASVSGNTTSSYTPRTLNDYLNSHGGYTSTGDIYWGTAAAMDGSNSGLVYRGAISGNFAALDAELNQCRRVIVNVNNGGHWVMVVRRNGPSGVGSSYKVLDPGNSSYTSRTLANFNNTFSTGRSFSGTWKTGMFYMPMETSTEEDDYVTFNDGHETGYLIPLSRTAVLPTEQLLSDSQGAVEMTVSPNPTTGLVNVSYKLMKETAMVLTVTSLDGRIVKQVSLDSGIGEAAYQIDISSEQNGLYILSLKTESEVLTSKVLLVK